MIPFKNTDGDTDYFNIVAGMLPGDTLAPYLFIICQDYVLTTSIDKMKDKFQASKGKKQNIPRTTIKDADYADDITLQENTPSQAKALQYSLERGGTGISLHVSANETEYVCVNQRSDFSTLNGNSLKLVDKFIYLGKSVSSIEADINT